jgi:hypothetical protein
MSGRSRRLVLKWSIPADVSVLVARRTTQSIAEQVTWAVISEVSQGLEPIRTETSICIKKEIGNAG